MEKLPRYNYTPPLKTIDKPLVIGIDPGFTGAIAVVDIENMVLVDLIDMPTFKSQSGAHVSGFKKEIDIHKVVTRLDLYTPSVALAVMEKPEMRTGQGLASTSRSHHAAGQLYGAMAGLYLPIIPVVPGAWKMSIGLSSTKSKSFDLATKLFPDNKNLWKLKKHHDRCEAILLTYFAKRYLKSELKRCRV